jgi:hypothetical protein
MLSLGVQQRKKKGKRGNVLAVQAIEQAGEQGEQKKADEEKYPN